jgi:hypothetical protein
MSATDPRWDGVASLDLLDAADSYETTAIRILEHIPRPAADDRELAAFLCQTAADYRTEIARRLNVLALR